MGLVYLPSFTIKMSHGWYGKTSVEHPPDMTKEQLWRSWSDVATTVARGYWNESTLASKNCQVNQNDLLIP